MTFNLHAIGCDVGQPHSFNKSYLKALVWLVDYSWYFCVCRVSGPQGTVVPLTIIDDPADWKAADLRGREDEYTYTFNDSDIAELRAAVGKLEERGITSSHQIQQVSHLVSHRIWPPRNEIYLAFSLRCASRCFGLLATRAGEERQGNLSLRFSQY